MENIIKSQEKKKTNVEIIASFTQSLPIGMMLSKTSINEVIPITETIAAHFFGTVYWFSKRAKRIPTTK